MTAGRTMSDGVRKRYTGLFSPQHAPTARAYCTLFSFTGGIVLVTAGSVFCSVISRHPVSGGHPMHTPPLPLAILVILSGLTLIVASVVTIWRYGMDDGDDSLEDDTLHFGFDDQLDQQYKHNLDELHQQLMLERYIEEQIKRTRESTSCNHQHCCCTRNNKLNIIGTETTKTINVNSGRSEIPVIGNRNSSCESVNLQRNQINESSNKSKSCVFKPASIIIGTDNSATILMDPKSKSKLPEILKSSTNNRTAATTSSVKYQKVSSVIMSNNKAVRVVLDEY